MSRYVRRHSRGSVYTKGKKIYVKFRYKKQPVEHATGENYTPAREDFWLEWLDDALDAIENGTFVYANVFPGAKPEKIAFFTRLEGNEQTTDPRVICLGNVITKYRDEVVPNFASDNQRRAYLSKIRSRILPYFEHMTFDQLNSTEVAKFIGYLSGTNKKEDSS